MNAHKVGILLLVSCLSGFLCLGAAAQGSAEDEVAALGTAWVAGWDAGDMDAIMALYAADAEVTTADGARPSGLAAIRALFGALMEGASGSTLLVETTQVRCLDGDTCISDADWKMENVPEGFPGATSGVASLIAVRTDDGWKIQSHFTGVPVR